MTSGSLGGAEPPPGGAPDAGEIMGGSRLVHGVGEFWACRESWLRKHLPVGPNVQVQCGAGFSANTPPDCVGPFTCCATSTQSDHLSGPESPLL